MSTKKPLSIFEVIDKMPDKSVKIFMNTAGGRQIGKGKSKNAIIEVVVDNDTFQDFAFQKIHGHSKSNSQKMYFISVAVDATVYEKQREIMEKKKIKRTKE